jgi:hypothetical protein
MLRSAGIALAFSAAVWAGWVWLPRWSAFHVPAEEARRWAPKAADPTGGPAGWRLLGLTRAYAVDLAEDGSGYRLRVTELDPLTGREGEPLGERRPDVAARVPGWAVPSMAVGVGAVGRIELLWEAAEEAPGGLAVAALVDRGTRVWLDHGAVRDLGGGLHYVALHPPALHGFAARVRLWRAPDPERYARLSSSHLRLLQESGRLRAEEWALDWPWLDGFPPENRDIRNLFEARVPCLAAPDLGVGLRRVCALAQLEGASWMPVTRSRPTVWRDLTLGAILRDLDRGDPDAFSSVDRVNGMLIRRPTPARWARDQWAALFP